MSEGPPETMTATSDDMPPMPTNGRPTDDDETFLGLSGMGVAPAGVQNPNTGHHHLIIDAPLPDPGKPVPTDAKHRHFGGGQTQVDLELSPGEHTLQLILGDHLHIPFDPPIVSKPITIRVVD